MISIKVFQFNPFGENTYVLYNESGQCLIVDPGCYTEDERQQLTNFIENKKLSPVAVVNTHTHVDHILGNNFLYRRYGLKPLIHPKAEVFLKSAPEHASIFGIEAERMVLPEKFLEENDQLQLGDDVLDIVYTPGHADGSICIINHAGRFVLTGDVLFSGSIGRTDLPTGDFDILADSIHQKLYTLPEDYLVYPGHGPATSIGEEKHTNPYVNA